MSVSVKLMFCNLLAVCLCMGRTPVAAAQSRDLGQRIDRLDRARDRVRPPVRDRIVDRPAPDRPVTRDEPEVPTRDVAEEVEPTGTKSTSPIIVMEETGYRVRRGEILALDLSDAARQEALAAGLRILRETRLGLDQSLTVLKGDAFDAPTQMIDRLKAADPGGIFTPNHIYSPNGELEDANGSGQPIPAPTATGSETCRIGMIDGQPDASHPFLTDFLADTMSFGDMPAGNSVHGTAVALRLLDVRADYLPGTGAQLYVAGVLSGEDHATATAEALTEALVWHNGNQVDVLNISLAGPPNDIVALFIQQFLETGGQITAAVGNGGPLSKDIYPAAYEGVIGVTASTEEGDIFNLATRGAHVDLTAPGVNVAIKGLPDTEAWSGTSYAAPYAAIWLLAADQDELNLTKACIDTGAPGRDDTYGCGLISFEGIVKGNGLETADHPALASFHD